MNKFIRFGLTAMALMFVFNSVAVTETKAQNLLGEILKRMEVNRTNLKTLQTNVTMVKVNTQLSGETDTTKGTAVFLPGNGRDATMRIDWTEPNKETLAVVNKKYILYTPNRKQAIVGNASDAKGSGKANNLFAFINMSKADLKANFNIAYAGQENVTGNIPTWHLLMTPKNPASYNFKSSELWVDTDGMPLQIKITERNEDTVTISLSGLQKNVKINASIFKVDLPKGTNVIKG